MYIKKYRKNIRKISSDAMKCLKQYTWPGNVRELQHSLERAVILTDSDELDRDDFMLSSGQKSIEDTEFTTFDLDAIEKQVIQKALKKNAGNVTQAASDLGLTRTSLYRRMEKHDL